MSKNKNEKKYDNITEEEIFNSVKTGFLNFTIQKFFYENGIQLIHKHYDNSKEKNKNLKKINTECFQFVVLIKGKSTSTYRSILLNRKYKIVNDLDVEEEYYFKDDDNKELNKYINKTFYPILKVVIRKNKIKNVLEDG